MEDRDQSPSLDAEGDEDWLMDEEERHLTGDMEYWDRLNSAVYFEETAFDAYDTVADQVERAFAHSANKRIKSIMPQRPAPRRERKEAKTVGAVYEPSAHVCSPVAAPAMETTASYTIKPARVLEITNRALGALSLAHAVPKSKHAIPSISPNDLVELENGFQHMLLLLSSSTALCTRYNCGRSNEERFPWQIGDNVPSYFANAGGESVFLRKVLSICGLRNLLRHGPVIYSQLQGTLFSGDPTQYRGDEGLARMRRVTGNTVDLDTVVLRCSSQLTLEAINASNRIHGQPQFATTHEFAQSNQAQEIATTCAQVAIDEFVALFKLTDAQKLQRRIHPSQLSKPVPVATDNTTRGKHPLWQYVNLGQNSFHANVPCMPDVVGALLLAPLTAIREYAKLCSGLYGTPPPLTITAGGESTRHGPEVASSSKPLQTLLDDFFDVCIADSCFNGKWKSIEEYIRMMEHRGTIEDVLQRLQQENQQLFPASLFDTDDDAHSNEIEVLWSLANGLSGKSLCGGGGGIRLISKDDVRTLVMKSL